MFGLRSNLSYVSNYFMAEGYKPNDRNQTLCNLFMSFCKGSPQGTRKSGDNCVIGAYGLPRGITELHSWISRRQSRELLTQPYIIHKLMLKKYLRNHIDDVRNMMESQHGGHYTVYNLAERSYPPSKWVSSLSRGVDILPKETWMYNVT